MMSGESNEVTDDDKNQEGGEQPTTTTLTSSSEIITEAKAWSNVAKSFIFVEVSSLVLMFSCIGIWTSNSPYLSYALSVSVVSLGLCLIIQTYEFVKVWTTSLRKCLSCDTTTNVPLNSLVKYFCQAWHFGKDRETRLLVLIPVVGSGYGCYNIQR